MANAGPASLNPVVKPGDTIYLRLEFWDSGIAFFFALSKGLQREAPRSSGPKTDLHSWLLEKPRAHRRSATSTSEPFRPRRHRPGDHG